MISKTIILIMGLPGSGKTTLAQRIVDVLTSKGISVSWFNADVVRSVHDDWDFSPEGRMRQANRMQRLALESTTRVVICDFVAALAEQRTALEYDRLVWVDTIRSGRFVDTNAAFVPPTEYDMRIDTQDAHKWADVVIQQFGLLND